MIHVQNQNTAWGSQVREGELVRYQVKAKNSNVEGATVIIKDSTGLPLYELTTDAFGFTPQVSLPSDFLLDRNWNHVVGDKNAAIPGTNDGTGQPIVVDEDSCADGIDNDGDTFIDELDVNNGIGDTSNCENGNREKPFYSVEAFKFGSGRDDFSYVLSGSVDDVINLENLRPSVSVTEPDGYSFAEPCALRDRHGTVQSGPTPTTTPHSRLNLVKSSVLKSSHPVLRIGSTPPIPPAPTAKSRWKPSVQRLGLRMGRCCHPEGEGDITFRIRSYDGLDYSPIEVRQYKLNLVAPSLLVDVPTEGSIHQTGKILFQGTASDPYQGTAGRTFNRFGSPSLARTDSLSSSSFRVQPAGPTSGTSQNCLRATTRPRCGLLTATSALGSR